ncbi:hypothetical protein SAMN05216184_10982 [Georgenia satyanarayanai]|uniref:Uncharacterized protein n=1 Tax=Georgenia satyanarayanai TaxID=860221 RepID=A0A2Y9BZA7_9MICO|nr:hypothetical protein [Georgenia satyanarayanai]PYF99060.1 hypothetical protein A8987_10982 [Georgenia satyanarayanai]SSA44022.1 hypothetical protein SAMN05216184_10982 [Georgenia satyanarayanai]
MSQPPPPTGAPQEPWRPPAGPYRPPAGPRPPAGAGPAAGPSRPAADPYRPGGYALPYQATPPGPTGSPLDAYAYQLPAPRRRTGLVVAIVVGAVALLAALTVVVVALVGLVGGGRAYGEDADLDRLWDSCAEGDAQACDDLYLESPVGSEYEEYGDTCGGRFPPGEQLWCRGRM